MKFFGQMSQARFMREYWQKKPLLIRGALPGFESPLLPDDLAALAQYDEIESRLVLERDGAQHWALRNGPFSDEDFAQLPAKRWSLLVQAVDQHVPEVAALTRYFDFLPAWRRDDVMISYAPDKGGVGPHFDYYDVFLLQARGRRRWRIGDPCTAATPCRSDTRLRILKSFTTREEWIVEPGDLLYIPPALAHWGIAEGDDCMSISVGFRAPSNADILVELAALAASAQGDDRRYSDPWRTARPGDARITTKDLAHLRDLVRSLADDPALLRTWLGAYMTERKYPDQVIAPKRVRAYDGRDTLERHPASRFAWSDADGGCLFVDGEAVCCRAELAQLVAENTRLSPQQLRPLLRRKAEQQVIEGLLRRGALRRA